MLLLACQPFDPAWQVHDLGEMIVICSHCHALHWMAESLSHSTNNRIKFGMCCIEGKISLEPLHPAPPELFDFLTRQDPVGNVFRDRKSTRLNSSHVEISYAVFCLKK